jgi:hypothetical protein
VGKSTVARDISHVGNAPGERTDTKGRKASPGRPRKAAAATTSAASSAGEDDSRDRFLHIREALRDIGNIGKDISDQQLETLAQRVRGCRAAAACAGVGGSRSAAGKAARRYAASGPVVSLRLGSKDPRRLPNSRETAALDQAHEQLEALDREPWASARTC